jgi:hypothetical protein
MSVLDDLFDTIDFGWEDEDEEWLNLLLKYQSK